MSGEKRSTASHVFRAVLLLGSIVAIVFAVLPDSTPELLLGRERVAAVEQFFGSGPNEVPAYAHGARAASHTNNWAVLVCTSKFWFNYRHMANTLGMYRTVKRLGIPDRNIILMLADDVACNSRNPDPGAVWPESPHDLDLYGENVQVDYRGYEVTVENFIRLLTGRLPPHTPRSKRLDTDEHSNVFLYMTGHGGNEFLKFQDAEEISAFDFADAVEQMWEKRRYHELFFMIDTCQAETMGAKIYSPNVLAMGSSVKDESSYSYSVDTSVGVPLIDRYTNAVLEFMEKVNRSSELTMRDLYNSLSADHIQSTPTLRTDLYGRDLAGVPVTDFFGSVAQIQLT